MNSGRRGPLHHSRYLEALQHFKDSSGDNNLRALIAFATFAETVRNYSDDDGKTEAEVRNYFDTALDQFSDRFFDDADKILLKVANDILAEKQPEIISAALQQAHRGFRWYGVGEAIVGAFLATLLFVGLSIYTAWARPELIEYFQRSYHLMTTAPAE